MINNKHKTRSIASIYHSILLAVAFTIEPVVPSDLWRVVVVVDVDVKVDVALW